MLRSSNGRWWPAGVGVVAIAVAAVAVQLHRDPPHTAMGDAIGIGVDRLHGRYCRRVRTRTPLGYLPTSRVTCTWLLRDTATRTSSREQLGYDALARRAWDADHEWQLRDSSDWARRLDSIRSAFRAHGGSLCPYRAEIQRSGPGDNPPPMPAVWETWRFAGFDAHFSGGDGGVPPRGADTSYGWRWYLTLSTLPKGFGRCY